MNKLIITKFLEKIATVEFFEQKAIDVNFENDSDYHLYDIYVGRVDSIAKNIGAAFSGIEGKEKCFYQLGKGEKLKVGDELPIQITKERSKAKDAECSLRLSIPGKYVVVTEGIYSLGISSKFSDNERRFELQQLFDSTYSYEDEFSFILRTKSEEADNSDIINEAESHIKLLRELRKKAKHTPVYKKIYAGSAFYLDKIRDARAVSEIVTDDESVYDNIRASYPESKLTFYQDELLPLSKLYKLEKLVSDITSRRVWLRSGSYLVIDETEALTVIDVNTGKNDGGKITEDTFFKTNLEAAREAARQIRLRNLSGIILIDFIDMKRKENMNEVVDCLREAVFYDPVKTNVIDVTKLNLVELTRKKTHKTLKEQLG